MSRPIVLSNGSMLVGINRFGLVHDFYYPYVGLENHGTARTLRHRVGIWVDGNFSWLDDGSWEIGLTYEDNALIGLTRAVHKTLGVTLDLVDTVDCEQTVFLRTITVHNKGPARHIRLMLHQGFCISNSLNDDTGLFLPHEEAILHYKGRRHFLIKARDDQGNAFDQYGIGLYGIEGKEGTFKDAEDGELSNNPVEHGRIDSVVRMCLDVEADGKRTVDYWVTAAARQSDAIEVSRLVSAKSFEKRRDLVRKTWKGWLGKVKTERYGKYQDRLTQSVMLIKAHIDDRGSVLASSDTDMLNYDRDAYAYCWPRDAGFSLWPLLRLGYTKEVRKFFSFCEKGMHADGYMMHKYEVNGAVGSSWEPYLRDGKPILPIQEDETAIIVFLAGQFAAVSTDTEYIARLYQKLVKPMANFMTAFIDPATKLPRSSVDLWEQKFMVSTFTTGLVYGALMEAAELADRHKDFDSALIWHSAASEMKRAASKLLYNEKRQYFYKGFNDTDAGRTYDDVIDMSSFQGAYTFGLFDIDDPRLEASVATIEKTFICSHDFKGLPRYEHDLYRNSIPGSMGNPWFICTLWLAQYWIETGKLSKAETIIDWVVSGMLPSGVLGEQVTPAMQPASIGPLTWSQAEFAQTVLDLQASRSRRKPRAIRSPK